MIPKNFEEWKSCLVKCKINPTPQWAAERLKILTDPTNPETIKFKKSYCEQHLNNIIEWHKQIQ